MLLLILLALAQQADEPQPDEIVVRGYKSKCRIELAGKQLTDRQFDQRAELWAAGRPVRVVTPPGRGQDYKCLARIAFRLQDKGVTLIEWVEADKE